MAIGATIGLAVAVLGTFALTGTSLVPPSLALGPCLKDLTSGVSYRARVSPLATVDARAGSVAVRVCYGRPAARGRTVFGGIVPYGALWRMGANEPTRLYAARPISLAGIRLPAGRYSLYAIPQSDQWEVFVSRSTTHWGNDISEGVRKQEVGKAVVPVERLTAPVETLTIQFDTAGGRPGLGVAWERTRILLPLADSP
jgi:hypothetical protein